MSQVRRAKTVTSVLGAQGRLGASLSRSLETWIYVGTPGAGDVPDDAILSELSPPFQNGWSNATPFTTDDLQLMSFVMRGNQWVHIRGVPSGGAPGTVAFTLPAGYRPTAAAHFTASAVEDATVFTWRVDPSGDVWILEELISEVTSVDLSVTVTNPRGPTVDLAVAVVDGGSA